MPIHSWINFLPGDMPEYARLLRLDRPIGIGLLLCPCLWSLTLASQGVPAVKWMIIFTFGAFFTRSAGCVFNDIVDHKIDQRVLRTQKRPLAAGTRSLAQAKGCFIVCISLACGLLLFLPMKARLVAPVALVMMTIYPFVKRVSYYPQFFLGMVFNLGVFMAWMSVHDGLSSGPFWIYGASIVWTVIYDTVYAHQDREDDQKIGMKSTALKWKDHTKSVLYVLHGLMVMLLMGATQHFSGLSYGIFIGISLLMGAVLYKTNLNISQSCLKYFKLNFLYGLGVWGVKIWEFEILS